MYIVKYIFALIHDVFCISHYPASDLPQLPKRDNVLLLLFDILSAYQQTIPSSFAQTSYDFSHLPHILKHTEATLQPDIEERAIKMLLGFPEGKLRGFKEVHCLILICFSVFL